MYALENIKRSLVKSDELDKFGKNWPDVTRRLLKTFRTLSGNVANYWSKRSIYQDILSFDSVNISFSEDFYCQKRWVLQIWNRKNSSECAEVNYAVKFIELVIHTDTFKDILKSDNFPWDDKSYSSCRNIRKYTLYLNAIRISLPVYNINNRLSSICVSIGFSETIENSKKKVPQMAIVKLNQYCLSRRVGFSYVPLQHVLVI